MDATEWMLDLIEKTETLAGLNYLADVIKFDADHGSEYALTPKVEVLRKAWVERKKLIPTIEVKTFDGRIVEQG